MSLHVESSGEGAPLVMVHGWGLNLRVFDTLAPAIGRGRSVVRVDLPGHGRSSWDGRAATLAGHAMLVRDAVTRHGAPSTPWTVLGWSLGGQIALEIAAATPELVERLVLIATTPRYTARHDWPHAMPATVLAGFEARLESDWRRTVNEFLELQVRGSAGGERVLRELQDALPAHGEPDPRALAAGLSSLAQSDLRERLDRIRQPALVLAGQYDRITPPEASRELAERLPNGRYVEFRRAGHAPFLSHPEELVSAVREFLA
jgi:pimeloyl-[acyl-carrier protein] methyl ester esterase